MLDTSDWAGQLQAAIRERHRTAINRATLINRDINPMDIAETLYDDIAEGTLVLDTREDLEEALQALGSLSGDLEKETRKQDRRVRRAKEKNAEEIDALTEMVQGLEASITEYARANKEQLLNGGGKTAKLVNGDIQFRAGTPSVSWEDKQEAITELKAKGHKHLVVVRETLHKSVLREHREVVESIKALTFEEAQDSITIKPL